MTHTEQIEVYLFTSTPTLSGGFHPAEPIRQCNAPTWATVKPTSGYDLQISERKETQSLFTIIANYRPGFIWLRQMFITTRFGNMHIYNIFEDTRKRTVKLMAFKIEGVNPETGTGQSTNNEMKTLYARSVYGTASIHIPALKGATIMLVFREGIGKEKVASPPSKPEQIRFSSDGTFTLMEGDIFGDELITVLYRK